MARTVTKATVVAAGLAAFCGSVAVATTRDKPAPLMAAKGIPSGAPAQATMSLDGPILVTPAGMSLYAHSGENVTAPKFNWQCTDLAPRTTNDQQSGIGERPQIGFKLVRACLDKFRPYTADATAQPVGDFAVVKRPDGTAQWAYRGFPLYTSIKDRRPGDRNGANMGGFGGPGRGGIRLAAVPMDIPTGLKMMRRAEGLVLVSSDTERAVYTPRDGKRIIPASTNGREDFKPISAPAIARTGGDWSIVDGGLGEKQYAFQGKPLFSAPVSLNELEVGNARAWQPVVVVKAPALPAAVGAHLTLLGDVFTTRKGMTLYTYNCNANGGAGFGRVTPVACDDAGDPAAFMVALCGDGKECARRWRPYTAPANAKPEGEFSVVDITFPMFTDMRGKLYPSDAPQVKAWAYRGKPLFTYYEDEKPGDIWGDGVGGIWGSTFQALQVPGRGSTFFEP